MNSINVRRCDPRFSNDSSKFIMSFQLESEFFDEKYCIFAPGMRKDLKVESSAISLKGNRYLRVPTIDEAISFKLFM